MAQTLFYVNSNITVQLPESNTSIVNIFINLNNQYRTLELPLPPNHRGLVVINLSPTILTWVDRGIYS